MDKTSVRIYDATGNTAPAPAVWRGTRVNALLVAKGTWKSRSGAGVCLECTSLRLLPDEPVTCPF